MKAGDRLSEFHRGQVSALKAASAQRHVQMRRFGTQPLQSVAREAESEHPPAGNDASTKPPQVTVN